ncbi:hypothetical protein FRC09_005760 [Ceratobasidium sp. 395]|nr:hypothetical protein FRC09_005760 [Ceratobasidium sp. 395]
MSDFRPVQSGETVDEERKQAAATQESDPNDSSDDANCTKESFNNLNAKPESSDCISEVLKRVIDQFSPGADATLDLMSRLTQVNLLVGLAHCFMELGCQPQGDANLLNIAIWYSSQALAIARDEGMVEVGVFDALTLTLLKRWFRLDQVSDVDEAIECKRQAMTLCPRDARLDSTDLGLLLQVRFRRLGHLEDINQAIEHNMLAVRLAPQGDPHMPVHLNILVSSLRDHHRRIVKFENLDREIECLVLAAPLIPDGHEYKPDLLTMLGESMRTRFARYGNLADLDQAVECYELAFRTRSEDDPHRLACLRELGFSIEGRHIWTGDLSDLNKAVEYHTIAVQICPAGHPDRPVVLERLGDSLRLRYLRLGNRQDLERGAQCHGLAARLYLDSDSTTPAQPDVLALWALRVQRLEPTHIDRAIEYQSQAIQQAPNRGTLIVILALLLHRRYKELGNPADLDQAIQNMWTVVELTPDGHVLKPNQLNSLGIFLRDRFQMSHDQADIDLAITCLFRAAKLTPPGRSEVPSQLREIGRALFDRVRSGHGMPQDPFCVLTSWWIAATWPIVDPWTQIGCARDVATILSVLPDISPLGAYQVAFTLIPHAVWLGQTAQARYDIIPAISVLVSQAVAWAVSVGSYDMALEWLEQGRSVVWAQQLQTRTQFDDLSAVDPQLADRMRAIASQLEAAELKSGATCPPVGSSFDLDIQGQRHSAAIQWKQLLQAVRQVHGFEDYMLPRKAHTQEDGDQRTSGGDQHLCMKTTY